VYKTKQKKKVIVFWIYLLSYKNDAKALE